ncbi:GntR family transcriptional regulator [Loigolactobacillus jiayinensis]|uniref:GntR family transcriptional regulator n=1 Tax=Loigolactobacillus jiayinensis TaxID=2486016 RepID=A0ABW1RCR6_9LACO|nr:GntR family transcriptional regulator [Loigolactobacillus jiayinensis]
MNKPKYALIVDDLISKIANSLFKRGDKFYSESEIKSLYNVSSTTAVKVLNELASKDIIVRIQGKGSYVSKGSKDELIHLYDIEKFPNSVEKVTVVSITEAHEAHILKKLKLQVNETYFRFIRTKNRGSTIADVSFSYIPTKLVNSEKVKNKDNYISIYERLRKDFNINPYLLSYEQINSIDIINNPRILNLFNLKNATLLLQQHRITKRPGQQCPVEYIESYKLPQFFKQKIIKEV